MTLTSFEEGIFAFDPLLMDHFYTTKSVSTCYMICNGKILLLKRNDSTSASNKWCMAGGKLEKNETPLQAVIREVKEETGIILLPEETDFIQTIYIRILTPKHDYILHLFKAILSRSEPSDYIVVLNREHIDYLWVDPQEAKQLNLVGGGNEILEYLRNSHNFNF